MQARLVLAFSFAAALSVTGDEARAQTQNGVLTFDAVSSYSAPFPNNVAGMAIVGVLHGASATSTVLVYDSRTTSTATSITLQACEKQIIIALNRPGRFSFTVPYSLNYANPPAGFTQEVELAFTGCTLTQLP